MYFNIIFVLSLNVYIVGASRGNINVKESTYQCKRHKRCGFNPWLGRSPGRGHGNPLHYSCLENPNGKGLPWHLRW